MNKETNVFGLASRNAGAPAPVLCRVQANGRLDGVLFDLTLRQTYRNTGDSVLEVVYTFPLPRQAVLLGFASELNGERKVGTIVANRAAERQYEDALAEGDAPVMVEALDHGLHTANIGNLKPGDEMVLEVRFAQLLAFEQGRLRLAIPTTIAPPRLSRGHFLMAVVLVSLGYFLVWPVLLLLINSFNSASDCLDLVSYFLYGKKLLLFKVTVSNVLVIDMYQKAFSYF